jgi:hypothetical protein
MGRTFQHIHDTGMRQMNPRTLRQTCLPGHSGLLTQILPGTWA